MLLFFCLIVLMFSAPGLKQAYKCSPFKDRVIDDASSCKPGAVPAPLDFQVEVVVVVIIVVVLVEVVVVGIIGDIMLHLFRL